MRLILYPFLSVLMLLLVSCLEYPLNNPYPPEADDQNIYYDNFAERPKHLDPVRSYSSNEYLFLGQIYEPPLQYHFLRRPYELVPLTATKMPETTYLDAQGDELSSDAEAQLVHRVIYRISLQSDILYQPHPALAKDEANNYLYHNLSINDLRSIHELSDFRITGSRKLTAKDYVYQIKRMAHPRTHSPIFGLMSKYILGLDELRQRLATEYTATGESSAYIDLREYDLEGARVIDDTTFEIILKEKYPQFIYWLTMPFFVPMPWEADYFYAQSGMSERNISLNWYPIGSGPFMLAENNPNLRMVLQRNPNFRGIPYPSSGDIDDMEKGLLVDAGEMMPFVDKAIYSLEKEAIPAWNKFLQGYYDTSGIGADSFDQAIQFNIQGDAVLTPEMQKKNIKLLTAITLSTFYTGFNMRDEVIGGNSERARLLRQAISIAVDFEEFISIFANGRGVVAQGPLPPSMFGSRAGEDGFNPYVYDWVEGKPKRKSIAFARDLMMQAGYADGRDAEGKPLVLYFDTLATGPDSRARLNWLRKQFKKLNIALVIRATDYNRFQEKMFEGTAQIYQWGWNADYPDPENFLFLLYGPNGKVANGGENSSNYGNLAFDRLFNQMKNMSNSKQRQRIIDQMVEIVRHDSPWLWGYHPIAFSLHHSWYRNAKPNVMAHNTLQYKKIDAQQRKQARQQWNKPIWWPVIILLIIFCVGIIPSIRFYRKRERSKVL